MVQLRSHEWLGPAERSLRGRALETALAHGIGLDADSVTVVLAAHAWCEELTPGMWTAAVVRQLLWLDVAAWCAEFEVELPAAAATALWAVVTAAHDSGRLGVGSDDLAALLVPLCDSGGFVPPRRGRHRRAG
ncbi:MAG: hypothetical protein OEW42_12205 [Acidimicrobiia bacterium]|nr:hypothetical protein [Acidimicrobiia bacterium]